jgi:hypothetical protein
MSMDVIEELIDDLLVKDHRWGWWWRWGRSRWRYL